MARQRRKSTGEKYIVFFAMILYAFIFYSSPNNAVRAINYSVEIFYEVILLVLAAICLSGLVKAALPRGFISSYMGKEKGVKAYFNSIIMASILPGGGYVRIPLFEALLDRGADIGPFATLNTCRPVLVNFPQGVAFLGLPIAIIQVISTWIGSLWAGLFAAIVQRKFEIVKQDSKGPRRKKGREEKNYYIQNTEV